jgi:hypothetical protein
MSHLGYSHKGFTPRNSFVRVLTQQTQFLLRKVQVLLMTTRQIARRPLIPSTLRALTGAVQIFQGQLNAGFFDFDESLRPEALAIFRAGLPQTTSSRGWWQRIWPQIQSR